MLTRFACAAALASALLVTAPALAGQTSSVEISYADLDLTADAGKAAFERRIARAAASVCGPAAPRDLKQSANRSRCIATALESTRPSVELAYRNAGQRQLAARDASVRVAP